MKEAHLMVGFFFWLQEEARKTQTRKISSDKTREAKGKLPATVRHRSGYKARAQAGMKSYGHE